MRTRLLLNESEAQILRGICYARIVVLKAGNPHSVEDLPLNYVLDEHTARMALHVIDFYRSIVMFNVEAVKRMAAVYQDPHTNGGYYEGLIGDYKAIIDNLEISSVSVLNLNRRIKDYVKGQK